MTNDLALIEELDRKNRLIEELAKDIATLEDRRYELEDLVGELKHKLATAEQTIDELHWLVDRHETHRRW